MPNVLLPYLTAVEKIMERRARFSTAASLPSLQPYCFAPVHYGLHDCTLSCLAGLYLDEGQTVFRQKAKDSFYFNHPPITSIELHIRVKALSRMRNSNAPSHLIQPRA